MTEETELISYVKRGKNRKKIFMVMESNSIMPSEISNKIYGSSSNTNFTLVSRALSELAEKELVKIVNPKAKTGRLYELTSKGKKIQDKLK